MVTVQDVSTDPPVTGPVLRGRRATGARYPVLAYAVRRLLAGIATLFVASVLIFACIQVLPGNVAEIILGRNGSPARIAKVEDQLQLHENIVHRYFTYLGNFLHGDFGQSTAALVQGSNVRVADVVRPALENSLVLAAIVLVLFIPISLLLGFVSGRRAGKPVDHAISTTTLAIGALPEFLIATVLIVVFFTKLNWFPPISTIPDGDSPLGHLKSLILPILTLLLVSLAFGARLLRASVAEVMSQEYITIARLNGYSERRIVLKYLLPNSLVPSIQILAQQTQYLLGGIVVVESVFNYPGIGAELVRAIAVRDVQEIMIIATILSVAYILINIVADVVCVLLEPRVRTAL